MNISYNWLKDLVEFDLSPDDLAKKLTGAGLAVEGIEEKNDDFIFDIDLTSNRGDCLSHRGIAREITASVQSSKFKVQDSNDNLESKILNLELVKVEDADLCHRFTARIIRNVKIAESPDWLKQRLEAMGERSINNVADITNYVMLELGNPMHSFDLNKLAENRIVVRRARNGETIKTLDETTRKLDETMLMICDAEKPVAVGGVMGGFDSSITEETTDVLLEVAYFDRDSIRQTSRKLKLSTEASHRFERGVDIENLIRASNRATELIGELAGGEAGEFIDVYPTKFVQKELESNDIQSAVKRLTGLDVETVEILRILNALGIEEKNSGLSTQHSALFVSPTWRHDIAIEEDLVEEVARIVGYDNIGEELPPARSAGEYQPNEIRKFHLRQTLANLGFDEAISYSFIDTEQDEIFGLIPALISENLDEKYVSLQDSIIEGATRMRPTLLPELLKAVRANLNQRQRNIRLFEIGKAFAMSNQENALPIERELFSLVLTGSETFQNKAAAIREFDFYDAKGALETAADALNLSAFEFSVSDAKHLQKGQSANVLYKNKNVGTIGRLANSIAENYKFKQPVFVAEIDLEAVLKSGEQEVFYRPLPNLPSVQRDVSLIIKRDQNFAEIKKFIENQSFELLRKIEYVDVFEGKGIANDERSLTIRLEFRSDERTLLEEEVDAVFNQILSEVENQFKIKQRA